MKREMMLGWSVVRGKMRDVVIAARLNANAVTRRERDSVTATRHAHDDLALNLNHNHNLRKGSQLQSWPDNTGFPR